MAIKFRRTMKIAPGIRLNLGSKSASVRVGGRGFGLTKGTHGTTVSAGLPGSGLHISEKLKAAPKQVDDAHPRGNQQPKKAIGVGGRIMQAIALALFAATAWMIYIGATTPTP